MPALDGHVSSSFKQANPHLFKLTNKATAERAMLTVQKPCSGKRRMPNKTEEAFNREELSGTGQYEAITFRLPGGSRYCPDWYVYEAGIHMVFEVKGAYQFGSHGRAWTAFNECRHHFTGFRFFWFTRTKDKQWKEKA